MPNIFLTRRLLLGSTAMLFAGMPAILAAHAESATIQPIQTLADGLLGIMKMGQQAPFDRRFGVLGPIVDRTFDLGLILRNSIGPSWSSLSAEQQSQLLQAFRRYTIASYVNSFDSFNGQRFVIEPQTQTLDTGDRVVRTKIVPVSGEAHQLDYVMRDTADGWKIVDVLAGGAISRVAVQRSDFRRLLARGGAQALLAQLQTKTASLSNGAAG
jgi:phospholipid transport system substrate-binding protein